jgi:hypothetical protein
MSKQDLLKEAIADAKAVRETAIANAKLALEEAFTPKLQSMLSTKIAEEMDDELEEDELDVDAVETVEEPVADEVPTDEMYSEEEEETTEEGTYEGEEEEVVETEEDDVYEEGEEDDLELESIIRELEAEEDEVTEEEEEEHPVTEEAEEETVEEEEEEMDLEEIIRSLSENDEEEEEVVEGEEDLEHELEEAYNTIKSLKSTINEVNLLNSKLLFSNKLFRMHGLSESQKMNVIETFDRASSVREVKLVYTTLAESLVPATKSKKRTVSEGFASKRTRSTKPAKNVIVESNNFAGRMQKLAGLK